MIYLETKRLILRDYCEEDFSEYYRLKTDSETMYYLQDIQLFTKEEAYEDFRMVLEDMKKSDRKFYFLHVADFFICQARIWNNQDDGGFLPCPATLPTPLRHRGCFALR